MVNTQDLQLFYEPADTLRLTVSTEGEERSYPVVKIFQSAPLSKPKEYLAFLDSKSEEIALVRHLSDLAPASQQIVQSELDKRYLTARIAKISNIKQEFGVTYWDVATDRGKREFVMQSLSESCVWLSDTHLLLIDVDGNRFEITDKTLLDLPSQKQLEKVL
jgi:Domain of unknown function (DUF1854)